jgi:hypothetical protein
VAATDSWTYLGVKRGSRGSRRGGFGLEDARSPLWGLAASVRGLEHEDRSAGHPNHRSVAASGSGRQNKGAEGAIGRHSICRHRHHLQPSMTDLGEVGNSPDSDDFAPPPLSELPLKLPAC